MPVPAIDPVLSLALRQGAQQAEVFALETAETPVQFEANRVELGRRRE